MPLASHSSTNHSRSIYTGREIGWCCRAAQFTSWHTQHNLLACCAIIGGWNLLPIMRTKKLDVMQDRTFEPQITLTPTFALYMAVMTYISGSIFSAMIRTSMRGATGSRSPLTELTGSCGAGTARKSSIQKDTSTPLQKDVYKGWD